MTQKREDWSGKGWTRSRTGGQCVADDRGGLRGAIEHCGCGGPWRNELEEICVWDMLEALGSNGGVVCEAVSWGCGKMGDWVDGLQGIEC